MSGRVFINYRRDDSIGTAGRLHDRLAQAFGRAQVFMDVDHIPAGVDFVDHLHKQVSGCSVFLVIIGRSWLDTKDENGERRLDDPNDIVVVEIAAALTRDIRIIPVLVDGASMPKAIDVPNHLKPLVRRNAIEVRNSQFGRDADALVEKVRDAFGSELGTARFRLSLRYAKAGAVSFVVLAAGFALYTLGLPRSLETAIQSIFFGDNAELVAWTNATNGNLIDSWNAYLTRWPQGSHAAEIRAKVAERQKKRQIITLPGLASGVTSVGYTPDGKAVLTNATMFDHYAQFRLYGFPAGNEIRTYGASPGIRGAAFTPNGKLLVAFGHTTTLHWWSVDDPAKNWDHHTASEIEWVNGLVIAPDGQSYAIACSDGTVRLRAVAEDREIAVFTGHKARVWNVVFSTDGRWLLSGGDDGAPRIWDVMAKSEHVVLGRHNGSVASLAFSPDSRTAYTAGWDDGTIKVWDVATGGLVREITPNVNFVSGLTISRYGRFLLSWGRDGMIKITDLLSNSEALTLSGHTGEIWNAVIAPDGRTLISGGKDTSVRIWDISDIAAKEAPIAK
jgi:WD40 repeat protein